ncbi:sigma-54 factor interaction domain-containing protein [Desulfurispirillum indicum S5]|uniref:Sigma-54 factor interaction domain-containing protein n=1 Tax=Desulfurispirillum indicum (strain ATCC BAA-1389 / DSM 22839 / S5) TaxID=653733 RepID=E6W5N5_DESIS|nr:sigma-54 dependent transcriptional regulator [Desulfurispirillum indicum]ADU66066.1 sigma-54 factor interaction domain-containing protein [Desulfurispirillum indicum S5]
MTQSIKTVLVVDDEDQMRLALRETLTRAGYEVITAFDGNNGLSKLQNNSIDAVITDLRMPVMDGMEFLQKALQEKPGLPIVLMTAYATVNTAVDAMKSGAFDYIMKPFSPEVIESTLERVFQYHGALEQNTPAPAQKNEAAANHKAPTIITRSKRMEELIHLATDVASSSANVLVNGESGTGKELFARLLHYAGNRQDKPFVAVNCAALPDNLLESELFGYEKGAFTGAANRKIGKFEMADGGTLLLDEITEMPFHLQAKLLRVLQEGEVDRLGGSKPINVDVRIVATTNRDIQESIKEKTFREDLYYRLNVIPLHIPPLRRRKEDIALLVDHFIAKYNRKNSKSITAVTPEGMNALMNHQWHGNVRELENIIERAVVICRTQTLTPGNLFLHGTLLDIPTAGDEGQTVCVEQAQSVEEGCMPALADDDPLLIEVGTSVHEMEKRLILQTLEKCSGNRKQAADMLGITSRTLLNKIKEYRELGIHIE